MWQVLIVVVHCTVGSIFNETTKMRSFCRRDGERERESEEKKNIYSIVVNTSSTSTSRVGQDNVEMRIVL